MKLIRVMRVIRLMFSLFDFLCSISQRNTDHRPTNGREYNIDRNSYFDNDSMQRIPRNICHYGDMKRRCLDNGITPYVPVSEHHGFEEGERMLRTAFTFEENADRYAQLQSQ